MGLKRFFKKGLKKIAGPALTAASFTPAGRVAGIAGKALKVAKALPISKKIAVAGAAAVGLGAAAGGLKKMFGSKRRKKGFKGISDKEMMELMKIQMVVGKRSLPYQIAVLKAMGGKLK